MRLAPGLVGGVVSYARHGTPAARVLHESPLKRGSVQCICASYVSRLDSASHNCGCEAVVRGLVCLGMRSPWLHMCGPAKAAMR